MAENINGIENQDLALTLHAELQQIDPKNSPKLRNLVVALIGLAGVFSANPAEAETFKIPGVDLSAMIAELKHDNSELDQDIANLDKDIATLDKKIKTSQENIARSIRMNEAVDRTGKQIHAMTKD